MSEDQRTLIIYIIIYTVYTSVKFCLLEKKNNYSGIILFGDITFLLSLYFLSSHRVTRDSVLIYIVTFCTAVRAVGVVGAED